MDTPPSAAPRLAGGRIRTIVADDEPMARQGLRALLAREPDVDVVDECGDGASALAAVRALAPDLVLLDVQMPEMDGFEVLARLAEGWPTARRWPGVVFVTAYDRFAVRAFEVHATDYLLKPFDDRRFADAIARARAALRQAGADPLEQRLRQLVEAVTVRVPADGAPSGAAYHAGAAPLTRLVVRSVGRMAFVRVDEVDWIEAADYYVKLHVGPRVHMLREAMATLEARLDPRQFFRVHRSAIVNLDRVRELRAGSDGELVVHLADGTRLRLTAGRRERLAELLAQPL